jgi:hypothetical protein
MSALHPLQTCSERKHKEVLFGRYSSKCLSKCDENAADTLIQGRDLGWETSTTIEVVICNETLHESCGPNATALAVLPGIIELRFTIPTEALGRDGLASNTQLSTDIRRTGLDWLRFFRCSSS